MEISVKELKVLLKTLAEGGASEFDYRDDKYRLRVALNTGGAPVQVVTTRAQPVQVAAIGEAPPKAAEVAAADEGDFSYVTSPFVGTFYRAASPEGAPFVTEGSTIKPGQALCIIEAMKLMNEIEAEFPGTIEQVLVENGKSVEFGQKLFKVKTS